MLQPPDVVPEPYLPAQLCWLESQAVDQHRVINISFFCHWDYHPNITILATLWLCSKQSSALAGCIQGQTQVFSFVLELKVHMAAWQWEPIKYWESERAQLVAWGTDRGGAYGQNRTSLFLLRAVCNLKWEWPLASLERGGNSEILVGILREAKQTTELQAWTAGERAHLGFIWDALGRMPWETALEGHEAQGCWVISKELSSSLGAVRHTLPLNQRSR